MDNDKTRPADALFSAGKVVVTRSVFYSEDNSFPIAHISSLDFEVESVPNWRFIGLIFLAAILLGIFVHGGLFLVLGTLAAVGTDLFKYDIAKLTVRTSGGKSMTLTSRNVELVANMKKALEIATSSH